ncbi:hypothetical protein LLH00_17645 [bacterium]|nr:hypothetical protein [bacterium]
MSQIRLQMRCPSCGVPNRLRLPAGKRLRVRCGKCGNPLPVGRGRLLRAWLASRARWLFTDGLPLGLLAAVELVIKVLGLLLFPLVWGWRRLSDRGRQRFLLGVIVLLGLAYLYEEGADKLGDLLNLGAIFFAVSVAMLLFVRGPRELLDRLRRVSARTFHTCGRCGQRYFGWLKSCPKCGRAR